METKLLFFDEHAYPKTGLYSLTSLLISVDDYDAVRNLFYEALKPIIRKGNAINTRPPIIHGSDFLPGEGEEMQKEIANSLKEIINDERVVITRIAHKKSDLPDDEISAFIQNDLDMYKHIFQLYFLDVHADQLQKNKIILVCEDTNTRQKNSFSNFIRSIDILRGYPNE